jgi:hypothetical protein
MKLFYITLCLFVLTTGYAIGQPPPPPGASGVQSSTSWETLNGKYNNPKIVLDDKWIPDTAVKHTLDELESLSVIKIKILHATKTGERNTVYLITKDSRIAEYEKKFGAFSKPYADYLAAHQNKDYTFIYFLDRRPFQGSRTEIIDGLYDIPADKIKSVYLNKDAFPGKAMVYISTQ